MAFRPPCEMEKGAESGRENPNACGHQIIFVALSSAQKEEKKKRGNDLETHKGLSVGLDLDGRRMRWGRKQKNGERWVVVI